MNKSLIAQSENNHRNGLTISKSRKARVRSRKALNDAITLETLESRQLMTVLSVTDYGAASNGSGNAQSAVQAALNAARPGDTVSFPSGSYTIDGTLNVPTGVTVTGQTDGSSHIKFNLSGQQLYGFTLNGNDSNVTIENLDIVSTNGLVKWADGSQYTNIHITNNRLEYGGGQLADGTLVYGLSGTVNNTGTQVTHNYFHDSPNSERNWSIFNSSYSNYDYNTFYNINDGGQLEYMGPDVSFSYNYGTYIHRMGQETAGSSSTVNFKVDGNVFYDYVHPYNDTEGVSICIYGSNTQIENNYFDSNIAPGSSWGSQSGDQAGQPNRFGYAIEASGVPGTVSGNTLIGTWAEDVSVMSTGINVNNNKIYGGGLWGDIESEPGPTGYGSANQSNNLEDGNIGDAPAAPANTNSYLGVAGSNSSTTSGSTSSTGTSTGATSTGTTSTGTSSTGTTSTGSTIWNDTSSSLSGVANGITGLTAKVVSDNSVKLAWTAPNVNLSSASVQITTTAGGTSFPTLVYQGNVNSATVLQLHAGWQYDFTIVGTTSTGTKVTSQAVTIRTTGNSQAAYTLSPTAGTSTTAAATTSTGTIGTTTGTTTSTGTTTTGTSTGTTTSGTTSTATLTGATATVLSDNSVQLSWTNPNVTLTSASIEIVTTVGRQTFPAVVVNGNLSTATIGQLHPGWQYDFTIVGTTSTGATVTSNVVTVRTTGNSGPSYTLAPVAVPSTISTIASSTTSSTGTSDDTTTAVTTTTAAQGITALTATVLSDTSVALTWASNTPLTSALVSIISTVGRQAYPGVAIIGDADGVTITGLHAGWEFDFSVVGVTADGTKVTSSIVTATTTGSSTATPAVLGVISPGSILLAA